MLKFLIFSISIGAGILWYQMPSMPKPRVTIATAAALLPPSPEAKLPTPALKPVLKVTPPTEFKKELIDGWNLSGSGLSREALSPYFQSSQPRSIVYYQKDRTIRLEPEQLAPGSQQSNGVLFIGSPESIANTNRERQERSDYLANSPAPPLGNPPIDTRGLTPLPKNAYGIASFRPGKRDSGERLVPLTKNQLRSLQGPDFDLSDRPDTSDVVGMTRVLSNALSVGHGGQLILKVKNDGAIINERGFDFSLYENAFRIPGTNYIFQEFAYVGVSDSLDANSFKWFPCKPLSGILRGCAGAVPTSEGGDQFDLAELGIDKISYIWIRDIGNNKNLRSEWPTEGVDLDALRFHHAYTQK